MKTADRREFIGRSRFARSAARLTTLLVLFDPGTPRGEADNFCSLAHREIFLQRKALSLSG